MSALFSRSVFFVFTCLMLTDLSRARAEVLFEGFYQVKLEGVHVGYVVQRYEFDSKKKEFTTAYYLKTNPQGGSLTESLKARATAGFRPISYEYTSVQGDKTKTIDATFKGDSMTASIHEGAKAPAQVVSKKIPTGAFLSSFLGYVMLQGKEGIKKGVKYAYKAVAEEDADLSDGDAYVSAEETVSGVSTFKVLNNFKKTQFISWVTHKGEVIQTQSPVQKIATELVATLDEATGPLAVNSSVLSQIFGSVPKGKDNVIARRAAEAPAKKAPEKTSDKAPEKASDAKQKILDQKPSTDGSTVKGADVPPGQGIMIKGGPKPPVNAPPPDAGK